MKKIDKFLTKIPAWLSSRVSIFIFLFLFVYLVIFALLAFVIPAMGCIAPSLDTQLILGNYTNVLSALGASIAAGSGVAIHKKITAHQQEHAKLHEKIDRLHEKIDALAAGKDLPPSEK
jgi:hypothetical protein